MMDFNAFLAGLENNALAGGNANTRKIARVWKAFMEKLMEDPSLWMSSASEAQQKQMEIIGALQKDGAAPVVEPDKRDRRFKSAHWRDNPLFSFLMQSYLINGEILKKVAEKVDMPDGDREVLRFAVEQYVDAMAPTNFPATNPEVMEEAVKTGGESLSAGARNMMADMRAGMVRNTDLSAFTVGADLAATPGKVIMQTPLFQLIEYAPAAKTVFARPLLIVPPCINKYYILDLTEQKSLVRALVGEGHRVFLISWANAGDALANATWDDYLRDGVMTALQAVCAVGKQEAINTLGYCVGGTMLASALAALAAGGERPAHSLTLLTAMIDFSDTGEIGVFIDEESVRERERQFAGGGIVDGRELARGFSVLRANDLIWPYVIDNYYQGKSPPPFDLLFWNSDSANLPGPMFAEYLRKTYLENRITRGAAEMCGVKIDLTLLKDTPLYSVACERDHIVPWKTAYIGAQSISGKGRFVLSASGHIAGIVNPPASGKGWHESGGDMRGGADDWRAAAKRHEGGWWSDWFQWLAKKSGKRVAAPKKAGSVRYPPLEDAPGAYVKMPRPAAGEKSLTQSENHHE